MRWSILGGIALICAGAFVLLRGASFTRQHDVVKVGDVKITANEREAVPTWAGVLGIVVGGGLVLTGVRKRS
jgi:hypothetical protein